MQDNHRLQAAIFSTQVAKSPHSFSWFSQCLHNVLEDFRAFQQTAPVASIGGMNIYKEIQMKIYGLTGNPTQDPCITSLVLYHWAAFKIVAASLEARS